MPDPASTQQENEFAESLTAAMNEMNGEDALDPDGEASPQFHEQVVVAEPNDQRNDDEFFDDEDPEDDPEDETQEAEEPPPEPEEDLAETAGTGEYVVKPGDCMASIALEHGFFWESLWNDRGNASLREARKDPYVLLPGDRVFIPQKRDKVEQGQTEMRHRFRRLGEPNVLRLTILDNDEPRADEPYRLQVDGESYTGVLDENGTFEVQIPGNARSATLFVGEELMEDRYDLKLGHLSPDDTAGGIRARLANLGYGVEQTDQDDIDDPVRAALLEYQGKHDLPATGEADDATTESLNEEHHSE